MVGCVNHFNYLRYVVCNHDLHALLQGDISHSATLTATAERNNRLAVINADKVQMTGKKREEKFYWHTGYPGGIKSRTKEQILEGAHPERVVLQAVKRMLPGNRLSRQQMTNLRIYAGGDHPHAAQSPEVLDVKSMNKKNTRS